MDTNELIESVYAPGKQIEAVDLALMLHYLQKEDSILTRSYLADTYGVSLDAMDDFLKKVKVSDLLKEHGDDRLQDIVELNPFRYQRLLEEVEKQKNVSYYGSMVSTKDLAMANYYLNIEIPQVGKKIHQNRTYMSHAEQALNLPYSQLNNLLQQAKDKVLFKALEKDTIHKFVNENIADYENFEKKLDDIKYVKSDIIPGMKAEDLIVAFAVNYINKHQEDTELKRKVFSYLKFGPEVLGELYRKAQQRPVVKGYVVSTLGELAQKNWKRYKTFCTNVNNTPLSIIVDHDDIKQVRSSHTLAAMLFMTESSRFSESEICESAVIPRSLYNKFVAEYRDTKEFQENFLAGPEKKEAFKKTVHTELNWLEFQWRLLFDPEYIHPSKIPFVSINMKDEEGRREELSQDYRAYLGLDKENRTYENAYLACKETVYALEYVMRRDKKLVDYGMCLAAVKASGGALQFVPAKFRDKKMCFTAVKSSPDAYRFVPRNLKSDRKLIHMAIKRFEGGYNYAYLLQKDKTRYLTGLARHTYNMVDMFKPRKYGLSDAELKRRAIVQKELGMTGYEIKSKEILDENRFLSSKNILAALKEKDYELSADHIYAAIDKYEGMVDKGKCTPDLFEIHEDSPSHQRLAMFLEKNDNGYVNDSTKSMLMDAAAVALAYKQGDISYSDLKSMWYFTPLLEGLAPEQAAMKLDEMVRRFEEITLPEYKQLDKIPDYSMSGYSQTKLPVEVSPQDYFLMHPNLNEEARKAVESNFAAVRNDAIVGVRLATDFFNGKITADQMMELLPAKSELTDNKLAHVLQVTLAVAKHHPELVHPMQLQVNPEFKEGVKYDVPVDKLFSRQELETLKSLLDDATLDYQVYREKCEAQLSLAYRNNEISAEKYLSTYPVGDGNTLKALEGKDLAKEADRLSEWFAQKMPEMIKRKDAVGEGLVATVQNQEQQRSRGVKF